MSTVNTNAKATLEEAMTHALVEAAAEHVSRIDRQISTLLEPGEQHVDWHRASKRLPFIVRVLPFMPDLLTRPKKYLLVLTPSRLLIVRMTNPFNKLKDSEVKRVEASVPWSKVRSVSPRRHLSSSSVVVRTSSAGSHHFKYMQADAADELASQARVLIDAAVRAG